MWSMKLIELPDATGKPSLWINADHVVSVMPHYSSTGREETLNVELKVDGMPLHRITVGRYESRADAEQAFAAFMGQLQA